MSGAAITFDDFATNALPANAPITNGVYAPSAYGAAPAFPGAGSGAYGTSLASFDDSQPAGNWSFYVQANAPPYSGSLDSGWVLDLTCLETNVARSIEPGETITMLFAFRNGAGFDVTNLIATLLATNGVANPSPAQTYGPMPVQGPSVSRLFTFTAAGTNGQVVSPTFQLQDGLRPLNTLVFDFVIGFRTAIYSNTAPIIINDDAAASPYPLPIEVSGIGDFLGKATVMITNLNHSWPHDINILLVSPAGQMSYLMSKCGSSFTVSNATLLFDDAVTNYLPIASLITSGTYHPTAYPLAPPPFPLPALDGRQPLRDQPRCLQRHQTQRHLGPLCPG